MRFVGYWSLPIQPPLPLAHLMLVVTQEDLQSYCYSQHTRTSLHPCAAVCLKSLRLFASAIGDSEEGSAYLQFTTYFNRYLQYLKAKFGRTQALAYWTALLIQKSAASIPTSSPLTVAL